MALGAFSSFPAHSYSNAVDITFTSELEQRVINIELFETPEVHGANLDFARGGKAPGKVLGRNFSVSCWNKLSGCR